MSVSLMMTTMMKMSEYRCREEEIGPVCLCGNEKVWPALGVIFVMALMRVVPEGLAREIVSVSPFLFLFVRFHVSWHT